MDKKRSVGVTIIGCLLYFSILPIFIATLIDTPAIGVIKFLLAFLVSIGLFLSARGLLALKASSRSSILLLVVPYLVFVKPLIFNYKLKIEFASFHSLMGTQARPVAIDVIMPFATIALACSLLGILIGLIVFIFLLCPKVRNQFD